MTINKLYRFVLQTATLLLPLLDQKKVVMTSSWLHTYLNGVKNFTGITVLKAK